MVAHPGVQEGILITRPPYFNANHYKLRRSRMNIFVIAEDLEA